MKLLILALLMVTPAFAADLDDMPNVELREAAEQLPQTLVIRTDSKDLAEGMTEEMLPAAALPLWETVEITDVNDTFVNDMSAEDFAAVATNAATELEAENDGATSWYFYYRHRLPYYASRGYHYHYRYRYYHSHRYYYSYNNYYHYRFYRRWWW